MKKIFYIAFGCLSFSTTTVGQVVWGLNYSRTDYRNDAGLRGDAGAISGFFQAFTPVNYPAGAINWWHLLDVRHNNPDNNFSMQIAGSFFDQNLWFRKTNNDPAQVWSKLLALQNQSLGTTAGAGIEMIKLENLSGGNNSYLSFSLNRFANGTDGNTTSTRIQSGTDATRQGYIEFNPFNASEGIAFGGPTTEYMRIKSNGNVGIGTLLPESKLSVAGSKISIYQNGEARYHLYNGGGTAEWLMGQKSNTANNFTISKSVAGAESDYFSVAPDGNIGIGTTAPGPYKLAVEGTIAARKVKITTVSPWADYVFETNYKLPRLTEVEQFIIKHKHLPDLPSAAEVEKNGIDLGDNQTLLLKKVEELTLYMIEMNKQMESLNKKLEVLSKENEQLKKKISSDNK